MNNVEMFLTVIYTQFAHIINYFAIAFFSPPFDVIIMLHDELYLLDRVWNASRLALQVLRSSYCGSCGKKDSSWHTKSATCVATSRRRRYCIQRYVGNPISYFLDRKLNLVTATHHRGRGRAVNWRYTCLIHSFPKNKHDR